MSVRGAGLIGASMKKQLGELELRDFDLAPVWASDIAGCDEESVSPRADLRIIPAGVHGLWVRFLGSLADGTPAAGIAMAECPPATLLLHSFFVEGQWLTVLFPPAPGFALDEDGPQRLAERLGRSLSEVFPINISSEVTASSTGKKFSQRIEATGPVP